MNEKEYEYALDVPVRTFVSFIVKSKKEMSKEEVVDSVLDNFDTHFHDVRELDYTDVYQSIDITTAWFGECGSELKNDNMYDFLKNELHKQAE